MNLRFTTTLATVGCVLLASCYPYNENQQKKLNPKALQKAVVSPEQQKLKEQRDKVKAAAKTKKKEALAQVEEPSMTPTEGEAPKLPTTATTRKEIPVAVKVPGKEGYVLSPFNNKLIDVTGMASGQLAADPTYPESEKKHFRVP
jgi:hypothetical protein